MRAVARPLESGRNSCPEPAATLHDVRLPTMRDSSTLTVD
jgi:hypothetical protein